MKRIFTFVLLAASAMGIAVNAQRAAEYNMGSTGDIKDYNRIGVSYNNTSYSPNNEAKDDFVEKGWSTNGVGIDYIHGFKLSSSMPMFIETGLNVNFNFGAKTIYEDYDGGDYYKDKIKMQNFNFQVPVNYVYRFDVADEFSIAPYVGLNFKLHLLSKMKFIEESDNETEESDWANLFSKDDMGEDGTWNRFQMGWHVGVNFQYSRISLGLQYGTDFIPAFSFKEDDWHAKVNTGNLKLTLGFNL